MPRLIDHDARDQQIATAAIRVLERDGLAGMSVRGVATEAGLAAASLRRAFPSQDALRRFCLRTIRDRATARITALTGSGVTLVSAMLAELLPLDDERRTELSAQIQLGVLAITEPALRPEMLALDREVRHACEAAMGELARTGDLHPDRDPGLEADTLHALLDGVALHLLWRPDAPGRSVLDRHLVGLRAAASS